MKKLCVLIVFVIMTMLFCGCSVKSNDAQLKSGTYIADSTGSFEATGDNAELLEPYVQLDTEEKTFVYGASLIMSYAEYGSYTIEDGKIFATTQNEKTYTFEIKDKKTLVMISDDGKIIDEFIYSE